MKPATSFRFSALADALPPAPRLSGSGPYAGALDLLVAPAEWVLTATGRVLCAAAKELHRAYRARRTDEVASSLGAPTAAEISAVWTPAPRSLRQALLVGSKLVDLSVLHPIRHLRSPDGKHTAGQTGGLKPWFATALPSIPYSTAMRYRQLARLLRQTLDIPPALPLEWLLSDAAPSALTRDTALLPLIPAFRRRVNACLAPFRSQAALKRALEKRIGIAPCPFSRRSPRRTPAQRARDLADDAALLDRYIATLAAKIRASLPLSPPERRALACLRALGIPVA
ncbi:MAG: hypothetical protein IK066_09075 [Kiritimatiellae bacterium]|nr:hypothetical protein [Kiritimatiellia bacterium]